MKSLDDETRFHLIIIGATLLLTCLFAIPFFFFSTQIGFVFQHLFYGFAALIVAVLTISFCWFSFEVVWSYRKLRQTKWNLIWKDFENWANKSGADRATNGKAFNLMQEYFLYKQGLLPIPEKIEPKRAQKLSPKIEPKN